MRVEALLGDELRQVEGYDGENGWAIESPLTDPQSQDDQDALALFDLLERAVLPLFYDRDANGVPHGWLHRIKASLRTLAPRFTAARTFGERSAEQRDADQPE